MEPHIYLKRLKLCHRRHPVSCAQMRPPAPLLLLSLPPYATPAGSDLHKESWTIAQVAACEGPLLSLGHLPAPFQCRRSLLLRTPCLRWRSPLGSNEQFKCGLRRVSSPCARVLCRNSKACGRGNEVVLDQCVAFGNSDVFVVLGIIGQDTTYFTP